MLQAEPEEPKAYLSIRGGDVILAASKLELAHARRRAAQAADGAHARRRRTPLEALAEGLASGMTVYRVCRSGGGKPDRLASDGIAFARSPVKEIDLIADERKR